MDAVTVALISSDPSLRLALARAFEAAPSAWAVDLYDAPPSRHGADLGGSPGRRRAVTVAPHDSGIEPDVVFDPQDPRRAVEEVRALI